MGLSIAIWAAGRRRGADNLTRLMAIVGLAVLFAIIAFAIPQSEAILGSEPRNWLFVCALLALVVGYAAMLKKLRRSAQGHRDLSAPSEAERTQPPSSASMIERNSRHIMLREIGGLGQRQIGEAKVLVIGAGGLGSPVLQVLAGAGVGTIGVIDFDSVEISNLPRQLIHNDAAIGMPKVFSAQAAMQAQNPFVTIKPYHRAFDAQIAEDLIAEYDIVVDGSDSFDTRYLANEICFKQQKPLILGALSQWEGQVMSFHQSQRASSAIACYKCLFPTPPAPHLAPSCAEAGVFSPLPPIVGGMMAAEVLKVITGAGTGLHGQMLIYDALYAESRMIATKPDPNCPVCQNR